MPLAMPVHFGWIDGSNERTRTQLYIAQPVLSTIADLTVDEELVRIALDALTTLNETHVRGVTPFHDAVASLPSSPWAQRENGIRFTYQDGTTHKIYRFDVPGVDQTSIRTPGTDAVDLSLTDIATFVTAIELTCVSPDGNAITVLRAHFYGKNN